MLSRAVIATVPNCNGHRLEHPRNDTKQRDQTSPPTHSIISKRKTFGNFQLKCINKNCEKKEKSAPEVFQRGEDF